MDEGPGGECRVDVSGGGELHGLADGFGEDDLRLESGPEPGAFEGLLGETAVGSEGRVGDGDALHLGLGEVLQAADGARLGPEGETADGVNLKGSGVAVAGADNLLRKIFIGGKKKIEGGSLFDLAG